MSSAEQSSDGEQRPNAREDSSLATEEKELIVRIGKDEQRATVHSEIGATTRALLQRDDFEERTRRMNDDGAVVSVTGTVPVGTLKIQKNARTRHSFGDIISDGGDNDN